MQNRKWTDELIAYELRRIARRYDRMPSPSELAKVGLKSLASAVYSRGGFDVWCNKLGLRKKAPWELRGL